MTYRHHYNLACLFNQVVSDNAARPALRYPSRVIGYDELFGLSSRLAFLLRERGCARGDVIAIGHNKQPLSYALMFAALRLGVAYVNIDVASPIARTGRILEVSEPRVLFYDDPAYAQAMAELAGAAGIEALLLEEQALPVPPSRFGAELKKVSGLVDGATIAYIMFTSGSTGTPKGVAVTHQNLLHFISWGADRFSVTADENFANLSPMYFDNSVFDFYVALFSGASISPVPRELLTNSYDLVSHVSGLGCTIWFSVPSLFIYLMAMKAMDAEALKSLRVLAFGGEGYPKPELLKLYRMFSPRVALVNVYGPTECTCICSAHTLTAEDFSDLTGLPTLGRLNPNFDYRIVDEEGHDVAEGELCLIGPNVAAGYFNDQERTAESFFTIMDPGRYMKRMYRTGDLVRESEGWLYFVGRKDNQIKHMGYRIELEEIEHALGRLPGVNQAAVVYQRSNLAYGKLIGYVACVDATDEKSLLVALAEQLPEYMVPSRLFVLSDLPKNPNGKVDRRRLLSQLDK
jgi:D-alanine--poly(phosphoribitol) ligase subunit 1